MRVMGLDVGEKRIGVAMSDPQGLLATPVGVMQRTAIAKDLARLAALAAEQDVQEIVVGFPRSLSGDVGPQASRVREFAQRLADRVPLPVKLWDERLTTVAAQRALGSGKPGKRRPKGDVDSAAAALILQNYLDARSCKG